MSAPPKPTVVFRVIIGGVMLAAFAAVMILRPSGGGGVDLFTEDLAVEGIEPAAFIESDAAIQPTEPSNATGSDGATSPANAGTAQGQDQPTEPNAADVAGAPEALAQVAGQDGGDAPNTDDVITFGPAATTDGTVTTENQTGTEAAATSATANPTRTPGTAFTPAVDRITATTTANTTTANTAAGADRVTSRTGEDASITGQPTTPSRATPAAAQTQTPTQQTPTQTTPAGTTTNTNTTTNTTGPAPVPTGPWCQIEVRQSDGIIRWHDEDKTTVFRRNDAWFHTPDEAAQAVRIPETVDTRDDYVMRLWGGGTTDVACTFVDSAAVVASPAATASPTPATPEVAATQAFPTPIRVPGGRVQMGFSADVWGNDRTNYWNDLEATPGAGRLIAHEFKSFTRPIKTDLYQWHIDEGRDLLLTWNGTDAETILNGSHDDWIREHARELRSLSDTVMLRFWHEPDVRHKREWIDHDPQQFIDSWNYVRQIFVEENATNIEWVWCPTAWNWNEQGARYYPGDANVDWLCSDGYTGWDLNAPLTDIADAYTDFQAWADQRPHKPILIAEFGAGQRGPGERAEWVNGIDDWVSASPNIRAVVYFDIDMRPNGEIYDWRLRTEPDAWQNMLDLIGSAPFGR